MSTKICPYCLGEFRGSTGLSIHLAKSPSCADQRNREAAAIDEGSAARMSGLSLFRRSIMGGVEEGRQWLPNTPPTAILGEEVDNGDSYLEDNEEDNQATNLLEYPVFNNRDFRFRSSNAEGGSTSGDVDFNFTLELVYLIMTCNNGNGLSKSDQNNLLSLLNDRRANLSDLKIKSADGVEKFMQAFEKATFGEDVTFNVHYIVWNGMLLPLQFCFVVDN